MSSVSRTKQIGQTSYLNNTLQRKANSSFISKDQRFKYQKNNLPGPGSYEPNDKNFRLNNYHVPKDTSYHSSIRKQHMWIWGSTRTSYLNNNKAANIVGPGSYNLNEPILNNGHKTNWGKSDRFNKQTIKKNLTQAPGPGEYETLSGKNLVQRNKVGSVFMSKSPKSYFDKLVSQQSVSPKKNSIEIQNMLENINPEMGSQKSLNKSQEARSSNKTKQQSIFASKIPRFSQKKGQNDLGPGYYDLPELNKSKSKQKILPKIISVQSDDRSKKIKNRKKINEQPGPGSYNNKLNTIEKSIDQNKKSIIMQRQQRFNNKVQSRPGPGHYMQDKYLYANKKPKIQNTKASFGSSSQRIIQNEITSLHPFGNYNVDIFDIEYKMKKKQEHLQKLKIMEVTLPAFNSKSRK